MKYLFDTNAIIGISKRSMQKALSEKNDLLVSPYCFYEMLCHIDKNGKFEYYKKRIVKLKYFEILNDPFAELCQKIRSTESLNPSRLNSKDLMDKLLPVIKKSNSLDEFYDSEIIDKKSQLRIVNNVAKKVREELKKEEERFLEELHSVINVLIKLGYDKDKLLSLSPEGFVNLTYPRIELLSEEFPSNLQKTNNQHKVIVLDATFLFYGIMITLIKDYLKNDNNDLRSINFQRNQMEDTYILLHMSLSQSITLVTGEHKNIRAFKDVIKSFKEYWEKSKMEFPINCNIISNDEFKEKFKV